MDVSARIPLLLAVPGLLMLSTACDDPEPPVPSDQLVTPYQILLEYSVEAEGPGPDEVVARARLYDITQVYDVFGNAGTVELVGEDAVFADDVELDIETRTTIGSTLRVDYSQTVASAGSHTTELRRGGDERIVSTIGVPDPFDVDPIGEVSNQGTGTVTVTWSPVLDGATIDLSLEPLDDDCISIIGGGPAAHVETGVDDGGSYRLNTSSYHSADKDCRYDLVMTRRYVEQASGTWHKEGQEIPSSDVWAIGLRTTRARFAALQAN